VSDPARTTVVVATDEVWLDLAGFAHACGTSSGFVEELILEGLIVPRISTPAPGFGGAEIARVRRILRLQRDFDATLASVAVMLDLIDEIEQLRRQLRRAGLEAR